MLFILAFQKEHCKGGGGQKERAGDFEQGTGLFFHGPFFSLDKSFIRDERKLLSAEFQLFEKVTGTHLKFFLKDPGKVGRVGKTYIIGDFRYVQVRGFEEVFGFFQAEMPDELDRSEAGQGFEFPVELDLAEIHPLGKVWNVEFRF